MSDTMNLGPIPENHKPERLNLGDVNLGSHKRMRIGEAEAAAPAPRVVAPPKVATPLPNVKLESVPLARLKSMARMKSISLAGCFEKADILAALRGGGITDTDAALDAQRQKEAEEKAKADAAAKASGTMPMTKPAFEKGTPDGPVFGTIRGKAQVKAPGMSPQTTATMQKYSDAGRLKTEIEILKKENERLNTENQAMKWRLGLGAMKDEEEYQQKLAEFNAEQERKRKEREAKEAEGSRLAALEAQRLNPLNRPPPGTRAPRPPQEWSQPDENASETGLDLSGVPTPKAMAAEATRRRLGLSKGAYILPKPDVDPVCWEWKNGTCKNGHNCPWQHSLKPEDDMRSSQVG